MKTLTLSPCHSLRSFFTPGSLLALGLVALSAAGVRAQTTPANPQAAQPSSGLIIQPLGSGIPANIPNSSAHKYKGPKSVLYIDGKRQETSVLTSLNPSDIVSIEVLKGDAAGRVAKGLGPDEAQRGVLFVTTKAGEHTPAVSAFNKRLNELATQPANPRQPGIEADRYIARSLPTEARYYLNGQLTTKERVYELDPQHIANIHILKGKAAADYAQDPTATGVILVSTK